MALITEKEEIEFARAEQAIIAALAQMHCVKSNRESSLVITKLQEAKHWLRESYEAACRD